MRVVLTDPAEPIAERIVTGAGRVDVMLGAMPEFIAAACAPSPGARRRPRRCRPASR